MKRVKQGMTLKEIKLCDLYKTKCTLKVLDALECISGDDLNFIGVGKSSIPSSFEDWNLKSDGGGR